KAIEPTAAPKFPNHLLNVIMSSPHRVHVSRFLRPRSPPREWPALRRCAGKSTHRGLKVARGHDSSGFGAESARNAGGVVSTGETLCSIGRTDATSSGAA